MLIGKLKWLPLACGLLCVMAYAQEMRLAPGQAIEREIAGGESHSYPIPLTAGQLVRVRLEQRALNCRLILAAPDGRQVAEFDSTDAGESELLALEALPAGDYRLTVRGIGTAAMRGSYRLEATVQETATSQDRRFLTAQTLLLDAEELGRQMPKTAPQVIEKLEQALPIWRELGETYWQAWTLSKIGRTHIRSNQN